MTHSTLRFLCLGVTTLLNFLRAHWRIHTLSITQKRIWQTSTELEFSVSFLFTCWRHPVDSFRVLSFIMFIWPKWTIYCSLGWANNRTLLWLYQMSFVRHYKKLLDEQKKFIWLSTKLRWLFFKKEVQSHLFLQWKLNGTVEFVWMKK